MPEISYTPETYTIHYGTDSSSLTQTSTTVHSGIPDSPGTQRFSLTVSGLQENVVYYFRVEAVNSVGSVQSQLGTFMIEDVRKWQQYSLLTLVFICFHPSISFFLFHPFISIFFPLSLMHSSGYLFI